MAILLWFLCGIIAAGWMLREEYETHQGITIGDLIIGTLLFLAGPIVLVLLVVMSIWDWIEKNGSKVVIKKRKYDI